MTDKPTIGTGSDDPELVARLALVLESTERGEQPDLTAICADRPDLLPDLEAALAERDDLPQLHSAAATFDPLVGTVVGERYALRERIGSGGMGVVYRAEDLELRRAVALKMLRPELMSGDELEARLAREAEVLASVRHSAVVTVFDRGRTADGRTFLVMTLLDGHSASELLDEVSRHRERGGADDPGVRTDWIRAALGEDAELDANYVRQVVKWIAVVAHGLHVVHQAGVVHRDVKPSNIFVQRDGSPVLLDFGIVTLGPDTTLAMRDVALGTPAYMAPEQLDPRIAVTPAVDVYGLTATLYHLLTFERPFSGTPSQVLAALQRTEPTPAHRLRPGLPRDLQAILDKGMARAPHQRYQTAGALAADLEAWLDYRPVSARPVTTVARIWRKTRRTTVFKTLVAVAVFAGIGFAASAWWDARVAARLDAWLALWARVPPSIMIAPLELRTVADEDAERAVASLLDELVAAAPEPCPSQVIRAGYRFDTGQFDEAAADMEEVARTYGTALCMSIAERYRAVADAEKPGDELSLDDLPEALSDADRFVHAIHLIRSSDPDVTRALELLQESDGTLYGIEELALLGRMLLPTRAVSRAERLDRFREIHDLAIRLDAVRGRSMATTSQGTAFALIGQSRHPEARDAAARGVELAPFDFSLRINLGSTEHQLGDFDSAKQSLQRAIELQPRSVRAHEILTRLMLDLEDFGAAERWCARIPYPIGDRRGRRMEGLILLRRAIRAYTSTDPEAAAEAAQLAEASYAKFAASRAPTSQAESYEMILSGAMTRTTSDHVARLSAYIVRDPLNWQRLREFGALLPDQLDAPSTDAVRDILNAIIDALAPDRQRKAK